MRKKKLSVIVPTLQKNLKILKTLINILNQDECVSEIIVINNAVKPLKSLNKFNKVKVYTPKENMFVNPSWNYGISVADNNTFLIINDDIICSKDMCSKVLKSGILDNKDTGLVGINNGWLNNISLDEVDKSFFTVDESKNSTSPIFEPFDKHLGTGDWGSAIFGKKSSYYKIPKKFKIIYGDNYLLYKNKSKGKINYLMGGLKFNHVHSLSSASEEFSNVVCSDITNADKYFADKK